MLPSWMTNNSSRVDVIVLVVKARERKLENNGVCV